MPDRNGLEILPELRAAHPGVKVLMITMHVNRALAEASISGGAHGYIPKECSRDELLLAISEVLAGRVHISPHIPRHTARMSLGASHLALGNLTPRQHEIFRFIGEGHSTTAIAAELGIVEKTVEFHRARIRKALGIANEWGLLRYAVLLRAAEVER
jgi:DNA-binding NarL/FixJ family response regulator